MLGQHEAHDILVEVHAEGVGDLLGDAQIAEPGIASFHLHDRRDECRDGPLGPGLRRADVVENRSRYFRSTNDLWNFNNDITLKKKRKKPTPRMREE